MTSIVAPLTCLIKTNVRSGRSFAETRRASVLRRSAAGPVQVVARTSIDTKKDLPALKDLPTRTNAYGLYGAVAPFKDGFDPLGLSKKADTDTLKRYREAELTHGRVCMLAAIGILVGEYVEGSSFLFDSQITGPAIDHFEQVPRPFWIALLFAIGLAESTRVQKGWADPFVPGNMFQLRADYTPGDLDFDPLGIYPDSPEAKLDFKMQELNNGRLAMVGAALMVIQEVVTGQKIIEFDRAFLGL